MTATPKVVVVRNGEKKYRILLQSQDRSLFRITRIESQRQGVEVKAREQKPARVQTVDIDAVAAKSTDKGSLTVFTDHPTQPTIVIPFMVLD